MTTVLVFAFVYRFYLTANWAKNIYSFYGYSHKESYILWICIKFFRCICNISQLRVLSNVCWLLSVCHCSGSHLEGNRLCQNSKRDKPNWLKKKFFPVGGRFPWPEALVNLVRWSWPNLYISSWAKINTWTRSRLKDFCLGVWRT